MRCTPKTPPLTLVAVLSSLMIPVACDGPITPIDDSRPTPSVDDARVLAQFSQVVDRLTENEVLHTRKGKPYVALAGRDEAHSFGESYFGLTTGLAVTNDFEEEDATCSGSGTPFAKCVKSQMDAARECHTRIQAEGDGHFARCEELPH